MTDVSGLRKSRAKEVEYKALTEFLANECSMAPNQLSPEVVQALSTNKELMIKAKAFSITCTAQRVAVRGLPPAMKARMIDPDGFEHRSLELLARVSFEIRTATEVFRAEKHFRALYEDMKVSLHDWRLFTAADNDQNASVKCICDALRYLSLILSNRKLFADCEEVMSLYKDMLDQYSEMMRRQGKGLDDKLRDMIYDYQFANFRLALGTKREIGIAETVRGLVEHEIEDGGEGTGPGTVTRMVQRFLHQPMTSEALAMTTDAVLLEFFRDLIYSGRPIIRLNKKEQQLLAPDSIYFGDSTLALCANCQTTEPFLATYKTCGRCKSVKYCGKDCQVTHYQSHKEECKRIAADK